MPFLAVYLSGFVNGNLLRAELLLEFISLYLPGVGTKKHSSQHKGNKRLTFFFWSGIRVAMPSPGTLLQFPCFNVEAVSERFHSNKIRKL